MERHAGEAHAGDEVVWSREWDWPRLPAASRLRAWRPEPRTAGIVLLLVYLPFLIGLLWSLRPSFDALRGGAVFGFELPGWLRLYYADILGLAFAEALVIAGALLLLRWRRAGAWVLVAGLVLDLAANALSVAALLHFGPEQPVPTGSMARGVADCLSRLLLVVVAVLILLPRRAPAPHPAEPSFAPPAP